MFYNRDIYKGKKQNAPVVDTTTDYIDDYDLDKDLNRLLKVLPQRNIANREVSFWLDDICESFAYIVIYTIIGRGFNITCDNKKAEEVIRMFNKHINVNGDTIEDYIVNTWIDNLIHGFSLWRIAKNIKDFDENTDDSVDLQRVSPTTIQIVRDQVNGWRKFVQNVSSYTTYTTPQGFLEGNIKDMKPKTTAEIIIPDDPRISLYTSFFLRPPMDCVVPYVTIKYWILAFIRKYAEKMWAPPTIAYLGNEIAYPNGPIEMQEGLSDLVSRLVQLKNFSSAAFPGNTRVEINELKGNGATYLEFMDKMDQHIMFGLFSSIATRESVGVYKGNATADEGTVRFMEGIRAKIENALRRFYVHNLVPDVKLDEIHFAWPELRTSSVQNMTGVLEIAVRSGVFRDAAERRRAFAQIIPFLSEKELTTEEVKRLDDELMTMVAPSQPGVTTVDAAKGGSKSAGKRSSN